MYRIRKKPGPFGPGFVLPVKVSFVPPSPAAERFLRERSGFSRRKASWLRAPRARSAHQFVKAERFVDDRLDRRAPEVRRGDVDAHTQRLS